MSLSETRYEEKRWRTVRSQARPSSNSTAAILMYPSAGSTVALVPEADTRSNTDSSESWVSRLPRIAAEIGDLSPGWIGQDSKAPTHAMLLQMISMSGSMYDAREPEIEIDPGDGEISFIWSEKSSGNSIALTFLGDGEAIIVETDSSNPIPAPVTRCTLLDFHDGTAIAKRLLESPLSKLMLSDDQLR